MGFGDVLAGWAQAAHEHHTNLLQMEYENRLKAADIYSKFADTPGLAPEQASFLRQGALAHLNFPEKVPAQYKFDPEKPEVKIPVAVPQPAPPPTPQTPVPPQEQPGGMPQGSPGAPMGMPAPSVPPPTPSVQPPTPPPQTAMRSPFEVPSASEQVLRQQPLHEEAARAAGEQAGAVSAAQDPYKVREILAKNKLAQIKQESDLAKIGYRPKYDLNGEQTGIEPIPEQELSAAQQSILEKNKVANELSKTKGDLNKAEAEWNKSRTDPNSPVNVRLLAQVEALRRRVAVSEASLGLRQESQLARYYGIDKQGNPLPGAVADPVSGLPVGTAFQRVYQPTSATLTKGQTAAPVISQANDLIEFANNPDNEDLFGKVGGRWTDLMAGKIGTDDPRMAKLAPKIRSLASLLAPLHGFRSANAAEEFARTMPLMDSPEAFASAVREYSDVAGRVEESARPNTAKAKAPAPPPGPRGASFGPTESRTLKAGGTVKVHKNLATGKYEEVQ